MACQWTAATGCGLDVPGTRWRSPCCRTGRQAVAPSSSARKTAPSRVLHQVRSSGRHHVVHRPVLPRSRAIYALIRATRHADHQIVVLREHASEA
jgi:hypothetical protein